MRQGIVTGIMCIGIVLGGFGCGPTLEERQKIADTQYEVGAAELGRGNLSEAFAAFEKARAVYPEDARLYNGLGLIYLEQKQYENAMASFQKALELDPNLIHAHNNLGTTYAQLRQWDDAIREFRLVVNDPFYDTPELGFYNLGVALMEKGELIEAVQQLHKAVQLRPNFSQALDKYGVALFRVNRVQEAVKQFKLSIESDPNYIEPCLNLGIAYIKQGKREEAIAQFKIVLAKSTDSALVASAQRYLEVLE
jgi:Tfp pilus assembly protein PilF